MVDGGMIPEDVPVRVQTDDLGSFIPLDPENRLRSLAIWNEFGRRLGVFDA